MKTRPAMSMQTIQEAMDQVREFHHARDLFDYVAERFDFWRPTPANITSEWYCNDERIGWNTWLLCVDGHAALFCDGDPKLLPGAEGHATARSVIPPRSPRSEDSMP